MSGIRQFGKFKTVGLDTNIFIYFFEQNPEFSSRAKIIFDALSSGKQSAVTSIISLIEILSPDFLSKEAVSETEAKFFDIPNLKILELDQTIGLKAAEIRREYGFRLSDAVQLATALSVKAKVFITNDQRLKSFKKLKVISLQDLK